MRNKPLLISTYNGGYIKWVHVVLFKDFRHVMNIREGGADVCMYLPGIIFRLGKNEVDYPTI